MIKYELVFFIILLSFLSGCLDEQAGTGDTVRVDFILRSDNGTILDTSYEKVAKENNIFIWNQKYEPLNFTVGTRGVVEGIEDGVMGMKVGEKRTLRLPPEKAYGLRDSKKIITIPVIQEIPSTSTLNKVIKFIRKDFDRIYGNHSMGDIIQLQKSSLNFTITNITDEYVQLNSNLKTGDTAWIKKWNASVISVNETTVVLKSIVQINDTGYYFNGIWNSTVINISDSNITFRHNRLPNMTIFSLEGWSELSFNDTFITLDYNDHLAGQTLIYEIELRSVRHPEK